MFEAKCPSCSASYQVDERRVPPKGLKMRCPKCGESFQVTAPGDSPSPPVLGAALGLSSGPSDAPPARQATMVGVGLPSTTSSEPGSAPSPPRPGAPPRAGMKSTMLGVAPAGDGLELAQLDEDTADELDEDELDLQQTQPEEVDLPAPSGGPRGGGMEIDLPSVAPESDEVEEWDDDELDLASAAGEGLPELPRGGASEDELGLPTVGRRPASLPGLPELPDEDSELPSPAASRDAELPDLTDDFGALPDLGANLPDLGSELPDLESELPDIPGALPSPMGGGFSPSGDESASGRGSGRSEPPPSFEDAEEAAFDFSSGAASSPPSAGEDFFGSGPTTSPQSVPPSQQGSGSAAFGEVDLGGSTDDDEEFDAFPTDDSAPAPEHRDPGGGGAGYGDVDLDGGDDVLDLGEEVERSAHQDSIRPGAAAASAAVERPSRDDAREGSKSKAKRKGGKTTGLSKGTRLGLAAALLLAIGGGALASLWPDVGPYGAYFILDQIKAEEYERHLDRDVKEARKLMGEDVAKKVEIAFKEVERGLDRAPRFKARAAFAAYLGYYHQLRFGVASNESAQAQALLASLADAPPDTPYLRLARLAEGAAKGKVDPSLRTIALTRKSQEHAALAGLLALEDGNAELALAAWQADLAGEKTTRAHYGIGRSLSMLERAKEAREHLTTALALNPDHPGSKIELARLDLSTREDDAEILSVLTPLADGKNGASRGEQVSALVLLGELHLERARLKKAEESFKKALSLNAGSASAQRGLAEVLFASGRYSEALARYESALSADPKHLDASLGVVRCKLRLEQFEDAAKTLQGLQKNHPESLRVLYWTGKAKESIGNKEAAQEAYEKTIHEGSSDSNAPPELVLAYVALTRLLGQQGLLDAADEIISQAQERFPEDPAVFEALGELAASRGSFDDAVADYDRAIALDPNNIGLYFARGIALRQARRFDEAAAEFARVEKESADYPGLALERGNLFEASGRSEEALRAYEQALDEAPEDLDLKLRVACARAGAGQGEPALQLLAPLLEARPASAEVNFCQGLAMLNEGKSLPDARRFLERAVARDTSRAKYHLYVGWTALDMGDLPTANVALNKAVELDQTLADAYWKRGELRVKQRAVRDALADLDRALELSPSRVEAHAQKAVAYMELGKEQDAMAEFARAVESGVVEAYWHYRYGDLLLVNKRPVDAREQLAIAVEKGEQKESAPIWLPDAHRLLATAMGRTKEALPHWNAFLTARKGTNDPYLSEALREANRILDMMGQ